MNAAGVTVRPTGAGSGAGSAPGSTSSRRSPSGSGTAAGCCGSAASGRTRTSTPSESPTQSGAVAPRTAPEARSALPRSAACSALWVSTSCQSDQLVPPVARVRTWTVPWSSASASSQTTPTRENGRAVRRSSPWPEAAGPTARSDGAARGSRGRDCVEPASAAARVSPVRGGAASGTSRTPPSLASPLLFVSFASFASSGAGAVRADGGPDPGDSGDREGGRAEAECAAGADRAGAASGRVRAAAQVTPTEVTNSARIRMILAI